MITPEQTRDLIDVTFTHMPASKGIVPKHEVGIPSAGCKMLHVSVLYKVRFGKATMSEYRIVDFLKRLQMAAAHKTKLFLDKERKVHGAITIYAPAFLRATTAIGKSGRVWLFIDTSYWIPERTET